MADATNSAQHGRNITIATSTIVASIWTGLWGFDWAASHLTSGQLYNAILIGLGVGTGLTALLIVLSIWLMSKALGQGGGGDISMKAEMAQ
jgi:hypothetical protein